MQMRPEVLQHDNNGSREIDRTVATTKKHRLSDWLVGYPISKIHHLNNCPPAIKDLHRIVTNSCSPPRFDHYNSLFSGEVFFINTKVAVCIFVCQHDYSLTSVAFRHISPIGGRSFEQTEPFT